MDYRLIQIQDIEKKIEDTKVLLEDPTLSVLAQQEIDELESQKQAIEATMQPEDNTDSLDERNVILEVKGAAGGDEAKLWSEELLRMYTRFAQLKGFKVEQLDDTVIKISGRNTFAAFKYEAGVHRVQRVPET